MKELNRLLKKTKFAITIQEDVADVLMRDELEEELNHNELKEKVLENTDTICVQRYKKSLYIQVGDDIYVLYFINRLERVDYFNLLDQLSRQRRCLISDIEDYTHSGLFNRYEGISFSMEIIGDTPAKNKDINPYRDKIESFTQKEVVLVDMDLVEERKDYIYFKYKGTKYEAQEIAGSFDVTANDQFIFSTLTKQDIFREIKKRVG